jgi:beta-glucosidase
MNALAFSSSPALPVAEALAPLSSSRIGRPGFLWGVATSSYQIEGAVDEDGRLPSIWDTYDGTPGRVLHGDRGTVACDHYHRWAEDVDLIASLGVDAYRLSIAWPRVMTEDGRKNDKGIDFYKRLLDRLAEKGLQRYATLYHWDLPQWMEDRGGWTNRETAYRFADYAELMARELGGRVEAWATLNEPWCSAYLGYANGRHAPGRTDIRYARAAMHHLLLGHGLAIQALRASDPGSKLGIVANVGHAQPLTDSEADRHAARLFEIQHNGWVLDPLLKQRYPEALDQLWPGSAPLVLENDLATIGQRMDFLGINYYFRSHVKSDGAHGFEEVHVDGLERTQMGWEVYPEGLRTLLVGFRETYGAALPPIYITENGIACDDRVQDGRVHDTQRLSFLLRHLQALDAAMQQGVDVRGYFCWSLMDNFEWAFGYERRFGLVHVDYDTQARTLKDSALAVQHFMQARRATA